MTNLTPNIFAWLSDSLRQSHLARDDLIMLIVTQNLLLAAFVVAWIVTYGQGILCQRKPSHAYLEPTTQPLTEPILILVTKVTTVKTEEIAMRASRYPEGSKYSSKEHVDSVKLLSEGEHECEWSCCDV